MHLKIEKHTIKQGKHQKTKKLKEEFISLYVHTRKEEMSQIYDLSFTKSKSNQSKHKEAIKRRNQN